MDFDNEEEAKGRELRDATPEDDRYAQRLIMALTVIAMVLLLLFWLSGGSLETPPPA